jgi:tetratricopeptide (TPR) repeat protein
MARQDDGAVDERAVDIDRELAALAVDDGPDGEERRAIEGLIAASERLERSDPDQADEHRHLRLRAHFQLARRALKQSDLGQARRHADRELALARGLAGWNPQRSAYQLNLSNAFFVQAAVARALGDEGAAWMLYRLSCATAIQLMVDGLVGPTVPLTAHRRMMEVHAPGVPLGDVSEHLARAVAEADARLDTDPGSTDPRRNLSVAHTRLAEVYLTVEDPGPARHHLAAAQSQSQRLAEMEPERDEHQHDLWRLEVGLANLGRITNEPQQQRQHLLDALDIAQRRPASPTALRHLALNYDLLVRSAVDDDDDPAAMEWRNQATATFERVEALRSADVS